MERAVVPVSNGYCMPDRMVAAPRRALALPRLLSPAGDTGFGRYARKRSIRAWLHRAPVRGRSWISARGSREPTGRRGIMGDMVGQLGLTRRALCCLAGAGVVCRAAEPNYDSLIRPL